jgi:hypothetical protein
MGNYLFNLVFFLVGFLPLNILAQTSSNTLLYEQNHLDAIEYLAARDEVYSIKASYSNGVLVLKFEYYLEEHETSGKVDERYCFLLKGEEVDMFKKIILKHKEWDALANQKGINLTKEIYKSPTTNLIDGSKSYFTWGTNFESMVSATFKEGELYSKYYTVTYNNGNIVLEFFGVDSIKGKNKSCKIYLYSSYMLKLRQLVESGKYDQIINSLKKSVDSWDEFKGIDEK